MALNPDRTCPHILTRPGYEGRVCGLPAATDGFCDRHGPNGRNQQAREATARRKAEKACQEILARGKRAGEPCGGKPVPGKSVCYRHDPDSAHVNRVPARAQRGNQCKAVTASTGQRCTDGAMAGLDVCFRHGGSAPRARRKSAEFAAQQKARAFLTAMGIDVKPVTDPYKALQHHAGLVLAWRDACLMMVGDLTRDQIRYESKAGLEQIRGEILLWQEAAKDATDTLTKLARATVDEKLVVIEQKKADMITDAFAKALALVMRLAQITDRSVESAAWAEFAKRLKVIPGEAEPPEPPALPEAV